MKTKILLTIALSAIGLAACSGTTYLRDGTQHNADGTYGHYAGTCNSAATYDPTTWFSPPVCFAHHDGYETVVSGEVPMGSAAAMVGGIGGIAGGAGTILFASRYRPDTTQVSNNAPTSISGNGPVTATNYAAGGAGGSSSSSSRSRGGNGYGGNGYGGAGGNSYAAASPVSVSRSASTSRATSSSKSSAQARNTNNNSQTQWQGQCQGRKVAGSNCGDP